MSTAQAQKKFWLSKKDAAIYAGVSRPTLDEWVNMGLKQNKIGARCFFNPKDIDDFITSHADNSLDDVLAEI